MFILLSTCDGRSWGVQWIDVILCKYEHVIGTLKLNEHIIGSLLLITTGCFLLILISLHLISSRVSDIMRCLIGYWLNTFHCNIGIAIFICKSVATIITIEKFSRKASNNLTLKCPQIQSQSIHFSETS